MFLFEHIRIDWKIVSENLYNDTFACRPKDLVKVVLLRSRGLQYSEVRGDHLMRSQIAQRHLSGTKIKYIFNAFLLLIGLGRALTINSWGMVDAEWWRAWLDHIEEVGFRNLYSNTADSLALFANLAHPIQLPSGFITFPLITIPEFSANLYFRDSFPIAQPPIFFIDLFIVGLLKPTLGLSSDYQILNLTNMFGSLILTFSFGLLLKKLGVKNYTTYALLLVWANPLLILQSNIQGYRDLLMVTFLTVSLLFSQFSGRYLYLAGIFFGAACLTKPTALYLVPLFLMIFNKQIIKKIVAGSSVALFTTLLIYAYLQRLYGLTAAMLTEMSIANSWSEGISIWSPLRLVSQYSQFLPLDRQRTQEIVHILNTLREHIGLISVFYFAGFVGLAVLIRKTFKPNLFSPLVPIFILLLYICNPSSRMNHYFVFVPIILIGLTQAKTRTYCMPILLCFFIQDFFYAGLGRNSFFDGTGYYPIINFILSIAVVFLIGHFWKINLTREEKRKFLAMFLTMKNPLSGKSP